MHKPEVGESQREHHADGGRLHHWTEGLIVVNTRTLSEALDNPASLIPLESAISPALVCPVRMLEPGRRGTRSHV